MSGDLVEDTGRGLAPYVIDWDPAELMDTARRFDASAQECRTQIAALEAIPSRLDGEFAAFKSETEPHDVYDGTRGSTQRALNKVAKKLGNAADQLEAQAKALAWLADHDEVIQQAAAQGVSDIDTSGTGGK